ncbi:MAG: radical SAM protein [Endomicrobia bacterium]|nr:radical SAM protein [Endomicrobiia bacterium]
MKILLINPPIYDFAAFDLWSKPLGLLYLASILKQQGIEVELLDYMDRYENGNYELRMTNYESTAKRFNNNKSDDYGCGHYVKQKIEKPEVLKHIPRNYSRYGLPKELAINWLGSKYKAGESQPELIIVTSVMTYWYPGVFEAIKTVKEIFSDAPVILGGAYATLCYEHAQKSGADYILKGGIESLNSIFKVKTAKAAIPCSFSEFPIPYYPPNQNRGYAVLRISTGCPFKCSYCAQDILCANKYEVKAWQKVFDEIRTFVNSGIKNIAFYDDALLYEADKNIKPLLRQIIKEKLNINIHTPNGLHARYLDLELAGLMKEANFIMPRFSLETSDSNMQKETGAKVSNKIYVSAMQTLQKAGYKKGEYLTYLLIGMPRQKLEDVKNSIKFTHELGSKVSLSEYSVIPGTKDFKQQLQITNYELRINGERQRQLTINGKDFLNEPLLHNKSIFPLFGFNEWNEISRIKILAKNLNSLL